MTEQEQVPVDEALIKESITYVKTENDVKVSIAQLAEDPNLISVENGRWIIDIRKKYAICLSEEFEQAVMSCTQHNKAEWVGFIVGNDVKWTNPENNRQIQILIAERVVILGQARTGASAEIKEEAVEKWMDSESEDDMAFKTVFAKNRWQKIGWVHSHADMGCFWSGTDTNTMKDMRGVPTLLSIVYSRAKDKKLERLVRIDKNDVIFGGKYNLFKDEIDDMFVISEAKVETLDDVPEEIQDKYKEILKNTNILNTTAHSKPGATQYSSYSGKTGQQSWYQRQRDASGKFVQSTLTPARQAAQLSKHTVVKGDLSEKAKEEIIDFGNFHYNLPELGRVNLSVADFFILLDSSMTDEMKPNGLYKKWKMKDVVALLDKQQILTIIEFYKNSDITVQLALKAYHNFKEFSKRLTGLLNTKLDKDSLLKVAVCGIAGDDWVSQIESSLVDKNTVRLEIGNVEDTIEEVVEETKPVPFMPSGKFTDWKDWYMYLPKKYKMDFFDTIFDCEQEEENYKSIAERIAYAILLEMRGDEEKYLSYAVAVYENLVNMWKKASNKYREAYRYFYTAYFLNAFQPFFSKYTYYNEKGCKLQTFLNALDEEYVKQFLNDFIVSYETDEELEEIVKKYPKEYPIYQQTFSCAICGIEWSTKADAESCEEACKKRGRTVSKTVVQVEAKDATAKKETSLQSGGQDSLDGPITTDRYIQTYNSDYVFGTTIKYYEGLNVCRLCGTLYDTQESAEVCEEQCAGTLEDVKSYFFDREGLYECHFCGEQFVDEDSALAHSDFCKEYGAILAYLIYMITNSGGETIEVVKTVFDYHLSKGGHPAPFVMWLLDKGEREKNIFECEICGAVTQQSNNLRLRLVKAFSHENFCRRESKEVVTWKDRCYNCNLCTDYSYSTSAKDVMQMHLFMRHGLYPTKEQISALSGASNQEEICLEEIVGETENAYLLEDGFRCKHCEDSFYIRPASLLKHVVSEHEGVILFGEYQAWQQHDQDIESGLYGSLYVSSESEVKETTKILLTDNVKSYNGIFVCKHCELTIGNISMIKEHLLIVHQITMEEDEEKLLTEFAEEYSKSPKKKATQMIAWGADVLEGFDYEIIEEELEELLLEWLADREKTQSSKIKCEACGELFGESESVIENVYKCFLHEIRCMQLSDIDLEPFICCVCGTFYPTIIEREICEMNHFEGGELSQ